MALVLWLWDQSSADVKEHDFVPYPDETSNAQQGSCHGPQARLQYHQGADQRNLLRRHGRTHGRHEQGAEAARCPLHAPHTAGRGRQVPHLGGLLRRDRGRRWQLEAVLPQREASRSHQAALPALRDLREPGRRGRHRDAGPAVQRDRVCTRDAGESPWGTRTRTRTQTLSPLFTPPLPPLPRSASS